MMAGLRIIVSDVVGDGEVCEWWKVPIDQFKPTISISDV